VSLLIIAEGYIRRTRSSGMKYRRYFTNPSATHGLNAFFETCLLERERERKEKRKITFTTRDVTSATSKGTSHHAGHLVQLDEFATNARLVDLLTCSRTTHVNIFFRYMLHVLLFQGDAIFLSDTIFFFARVLFSTIIIIITGAFHDPRVINNVH